MTFETFWKTANDILKARALPEMNFGEAWAWWKDGKVIY